MSTSGALGAISLATVLIMLWKHDNAEKQT